MKILILGAGQVGTSLAKFLSRDKANDLTIKEARNNFERRYFSYHLENNQHNIARVAEKAGLERTTLYRKLKDLGIDKP